jgi:hypothetical protein
LAANLFHLRGFLGDDGWVSVSFHHEQRFAIQG